MLKFLQLKGENIRFQGGGIMAAFPAIDMKRTGERIQFFMDLHQMTAADVRRYLDLNCVQTVYRWLNGVNVPNVDNLYALSQLFQVGIDELIVGSRKLDTGRSGAKEERNRLLQYYDRMENNVRA